MKPWLHLARVSNLPTVWTNVTAAWLLASGNLADARLYWLILAGSLLYTGGMILNDAADVKFDREHRKERPIPSGQVSTKAAWSVGIAMMVGGVALALVFGASLWISLSLVAAILFYDLYHKPWAGSVIVMGACRTLLYLMAGSAVRGDYNTAQHGALLALPASLGLGFYIIGLSLIARSDRWRGFGLLIFMPLLTAQVSLPISRVPMPGFFWPNMDWIILAVFLAVLLTACSLRQRGKSGEAVGILLAGIPICDALALSGSQPALALAFVFLAPFLRLWQRWVSAT